MEEQATFEARAVLAPRRSRLARLVLPVAVVALVAIAWAGVSGGASAPLPTQVAEATTSAASSVPRQPPPSEALGLKVRRLDEVDLRTVDPDVVLALSGWYIATAINDCPRLAAIFREGALPEVRPDLDPLAFCERTGVLYASGPDTDPFLAYSFEDSRASASLSLVATTLVVGVVVPAELEVIGAGPVEVVVLGRFVESPDRCGPPGGCKRELVIDYLAWSSGGQ